MPHAARTVLRRRLAAGLVLALMLTGAVAVSARTAQAGAPPVLLIGYGEGPTSSPRSMMQSWMNSAPHRANILTPGFRAVGLGVAPGVPGRAGAAGGTYTTDFGFRG